MHTVSQLQDLFVSGLEQRTRPAEPAGLYEPIDYIMSLGGKRIRPVMAMMSCELFGGKPADAMAAALAVETFHNFTLLHDDIMDEAPLRRGRETVHMRYGVSQGILSGDLMLIMSYKYLMEYPDPELFRALTASLSDAAVKVCEGQQWDMAFEGDGEVTIPDYLRMIEYKTAALLASALEMGALTGGASAADARELYEFGRLLGLAFQLLDDLLDSFGDPQKFGKKVGGDISRNKKTYLYLKAIELADEHTRAQLVDLYSHQPAEDAGKISTVKGIFESLEIPAHTRGVIDRYQKEAFSHLEAINVDDSSKKSLRDLAVQLGVREH